MKRIGRVPEDSIIVTADVVGLPPRGNFSIKKQIKRSNLLKIPANDLVKFVKFVVKNNFLNLTMKLCSRSVTAIKFTPPFTYTSMKKTETDFSFQIFFTHSYGEDIPTISFLFERMEKQN